MTLFGGESECLIVIDLQRNMGPITLAVIRNRGSIGRTNNVVR